MFPGQGAQTVGMGKALYQAFATVRNTFEQASDLSGINLSKICFEGPRQTLNATENTQPAIFTVSLAIYALLAEAGIKPQWAAGHSLGELSALTAAGALHMDQGLQLVCTRGQLMANAFTNRDGTMAAIENLDASALSSLIKQVEGQVWIANFNAPGQIVVSGAPQALEQLSTLAKIAGGRITRLAVSGAFHTPMLAAASASFSKLVATINITAPDFPVIGNVQANPLTTVELVREELNNQMCSSVYWTQSMALLSKIQDGCFIEVGPGKILKGLLLRNVRQAQCWITETPKDIEMLLKNLGLACTGQ
ncbi:hypothetical protein TI04_02810 [Achromatium sp. WMS2]|nr:hypothetical protein TI04_02810 [Achromatium sp. WMS2]